MCPFYFGIIKIKTIGRIKMELFNTIIGVIALIVAVIALVHSIYYNMVKIKLSDCYISRVDKGYDWMYDFSISNLSNVSVIIKKN